MQQSMAHATSSETVEWYTPVFYINLAREVMGSIDLDPASCELAQSWIQASTYWTKEDDGLKRKWFGNVWLNPPFGIECCKFVSKLSRQYGMRYIQSAILLVNSRPGYEWYERLWIARPVCLLRDRIPFIDEHGISHGKARVGQTFVYYGDNVNRFAEVFSQVGRIILPDKKTQLQFSTLDKLTVVS